MDDRTAHRSMRDDQSLPARREDLDGAVAGAAHGARRGHVGALMPMVLLFEAQAGSSPDIGPSRHPTPGSPGESRGATGPEASSMEPRDQDQKASSSCGRSAPATPVFPEEEQPRVTTEDRETARAVLGERMKRKHPKRPPPRRFNRADVDLVATSPPPSKATARRSSRRIAMRSTGRSRHRRTDRRRRASSGGRSPTFSSTPSVAGPLACASKRAPSARRPGRLARRRRGRPFRSSRASNPARMREDIARLLGSLR